MKQQGAETRQRDFIRIRRLTPRERLMRIVELVADEHGVEPVGIMGQSRKRDVSRARQDAYSRLKREGLSYPQIGRLFDRDHTTVIYGVKAWEGLL